jgi:flagellar hook-basal body complex protein FliE
MADSIAPISASFRPIQPVSVDRRPAASFADALRGVLAEVQQTGRAAEAAAQDFAAGKSTDVAATMIAAERAAVTFQLMLQLRNRLLEAYQEIQRIQV